MRCFIIACRRFRIARRVIVHENYRRGRFMEGFFKNATDIHGSLGWCPFGYVLLAKALVLTNELPRSKLRGI